jgi:hypothetical protein
MNVVAFPVARRVAQAGGSSGAKSLAQPWLKHVAQERLKPADQAAWLKPKLHS